MFFIKYNKYCYELNFVKRINHDKIMSFPKDFRKWYTTECCISAAFVRFTKWKINQAIAQLKMCIYLFFFLFVFVALGWKFIIFVRKMSDNSICLISSFRVYDVQTTLQGSCVARIIIFKKENYLCFSWSDKLYKVV